MNGLERVDQSNRSAWLVVSVVTGLGIAAVAWWVHGHRAAAGDEVAVAAAVGTNLVAGVAGDRPPISNATEAESPNEATLPAPAQELAPGAVAAPCEPAAILPADPAATNGLAAVTLAAEADALLAANRLDGAREKYYEALAAKPEPALQAAMEEKLGKLNVEMIRLPWAMAEKQEYVVQTNDAIKFIARKFGTTVEMIVKGNELKRPDIIRPGQRLKVFAGKLEILVSKSKHELVLSANGRFFKRYRVSTGRYEKTPVGSFVISDRIPEPPWHRDDGKIIPFGDKENILGTRWMAIRATGQTPEIKGYGLHGTWDNASIGKSESAGCIRLRNEDVEELFEMVPVGTSVVIEE